MKIQLYSEVDSGKLYELKNKGLSSQATSVTPVTQTTVAPL